MWPCQHRSNEVFLCVFPAFVGVARVIRNAIVVFVPGEVILAARAIQCTRYEARLASDFDVGA